MARWLQWCRAKARWGKDLPESMFRQYVLPYANVNERRDDFGAWKFWEPFIRKRAGLGRRRQLGRA